LKLIGFIIGFYLVFDAQLKKKKPNYFNNNLKFSVFALILVPLGQTCKYSGSVLLFIATHITILHFIILKDYSHPSKGILAQEWKIFY